MQRIYTITIHFLVAIFVFTACGPVPTSLENSLSEMEITYTRQGGFAGLSQEYVIHPDGRIESPNGETQQAASDDVIKIVALAGGMDFFELEDSYIPEDDCCDQFTYTITVTIGRRTKTVQTSDNGEHPEQLSEVITALDNLIKTAEPVD